MPNSLPIDLPPSGYGSPGYVTVNGGNYGGVQQLAGNPGSYLPSSPGIAMQQQFGGNSGNQPSGNAVGYSPPDYSQVDWNQLSQDYHGNYYPSQQQNSPSPDNSYHPFISGPLSHIPALSALNGIVALATGHPDQLPIVKLLSKVFGKKGGGSDDEMNQGNSSGYNGSLLGTLPQLRFDSDGRVTNGLSGGTGTYAGIDPRTGRPVMNASPAGNYYPTLQFNQQGQATNSLNGGTGSVAGIDPRTGAPVWNASPVSNGPASYGNTGSYLNSIAYGNGGSDTSSPGGLAMGGGMYNMDFAAGGGGWLGHFFPEQFG